MNLQQFRHFVILAEELHFGRAAARLHISQPPLSQSIRRLEGEFAVRLFERTPRNIRLTASGVLLLPVARAALEQFEQAKRKIGDIASSGVIRLSLGFTCDALDHALPRLFEAVGNVVPEIRIELLELDDARHVDAVLAGGVDFGLLYLDRDVDAALESVVVQRDRPVVALAAGDPLAGRAELRLSDLTGAPLVLFPRPYRPILYDRIKAEVEPADLLEDDSVSLVADDTRLQLVGAGFGRTVVNAQRLGDIYPGIVFRTIVDMQGPELELSMVWSRSAPPRNKSLFNRLADAIRHHAGRSGMDSDITSSASAG